MGDILIIKLGATGDVIRTTALLRAFPDNSFWITSLYNLPVVPLPDERKFSPDQLPSWIFQHPFDCILNLEESEEMALLTQTLQAGTKIGPLPDNRGGLTYTDSSREWFDMSLISKLGREKANQLKWENRRTYQSILFSMMGKEFNGEEYLLPSFTSTHSRENIMVGLEQRVGRQWPNKGWEGYGELRDRLETEGVKTRSFQDQTDILQYFADISSCHVLVSGDTLAMHVALGLGIPCITLFNCTSPWEIEGYHRLTRHISPLLSNYFYKTESNREARFAISVEAIHASVRQVLPGD